jgi:hypothetical protein
MDRQSVENFLLSFPGASLEHPFGEEVAVYVASFGAAKVSVDFRAKMFAIIQKGKDPRTD